ncbi:MAG: hypothetical protein R3C02_08350 [Planctomycetaceae bacterium]
MFVSFAFYYKIATNAERQRQLLDQTQLMIDLQLLRLEGWTRAYTEQLERGGEDKSRLGYYAAGALQAKTQIGFYSSLNVKSDVVTQEMMRVARAGDLEMHRQWLNQEKWDSLIGKFTAFVDGDDIDKDSHNVAVAFDQKRLDVDKAESRWTIVLFALFTVGTLLMASQYASHRRHF